MGETTEISWTDHTFNPWWGCTRIAPGCDNCYAAALDKRTGGNYWDANQTPRQTSPDNWRNPLKWDRLAAFENKRHRVFCGSMMDWCDNDAPEGAINDLFELIKATPMLDWQLLTKRATRIAKCLPDDWGSGYENVWLGVTVEDMKFGYKRIDELKKIPAKIKFLSAEPLLENLVDVGNKLDGIDWVIIGGESGPGCREMNPEWAESLLVRSRLMNIPVLFKQYGGNTRDKGGCLIDGLEYKQWPIQAA